MHPFNISTFSEKKRSYKCIIYERENGSLSNLNNPKLSVYRKDEGKGVDARTVKLRSMTSLFHNGDDYVENFQPDLNFTIVYYEEHKHVNLFGQKHF